MKMAPQSGGAIRPCDSSADKIDARSDSGFSFGQHDFRDFERCRQIEDRGAQMRPSAQHRAA